MSLVEQVPPLLVVKYPPSASMVELERLRESLRDLAELGYTAMLVSESVTIQAFGVALREFAAQRPDAIGQIRRELEAVDQPKPAPQRDPRVDAAARELDRPLAGRVR